MFTQRVSLTNQDARQVSATQLHKLGTVCETADGRAFRYALAGGTTVGAGLAVQTPAAVANHTNVLANVTPVNSRSVTLTVGATAVTSGQYDGGYLTVVDVAGVGSSYRIAGTPAIASAGTGTIALEEGIATALTATSRVTLNVSPWSSVNNVASNASFCAGTTNTAVGAGSYFWAQTSGVASVLSAGAIAKGNATVLSSTVAGAIAPGSTTTVTQTVSVAIEATVDTKYYPQFLTLE